MTRTFVAMLLSGCAATVVPSSPVTPPQSDAVGAPTGGERTLSDRGRGGPPPPTNGDSDGDRMLDVHDACPYELETYNGIDDEDGCPDRAVDTFPYPKGG